jgi:hypothetical protein
MLEGWIKYKRNQVSTTIEIERSTTHDIESEGSIIEIEGGGKWSEAASSRVDEIVEIG